MSRQVKQWKAQLRQIKSELPDELKAVNRRIIRNQRGHGRVDPDFAAASAIRHGLMKKEQGK